MLGFFNNLSINEFLIVGVLAVLVFGGRLPEVAARLFHAMGRFRRTLDDLRRDTGIDREMRKIEFELRDAEQQARTKIATTAPVGERRPRLASPEQGGSHASGLSSGASSGPSSGAGSDAGPERSSDPSVADGGENSPGAETPKNES